MDGLDPRTSPSPPPKTQVAPLTSRGATYSSSPEEPISLFVLAVAHLVRCDPEPHGHCAFLDVPGNVRPSDHGVFSSSFFGRLLAGTLPSAWLIGAGPVIGAVGLACGGFLGGLGDGDLLVGFLRQSRPRPASSALSTSELAAPTASSASSTAASSDSMPASSLLDTCCTSTWKSSWTDSSLIASIMELYIW